MATHKKGVVIDAKMIRGGAEVRATGPGIDATEFDEKDVSLVAKFGGTGVQVKTYDGHGNVIREGEFSWDEIVSRMQVR